MELQNLQTGAKWLSLWKTEQGNNTAEEEAWDQMQFPKSHLYYPSKHSQMYALLISYVAPKPIKLTVELKCHIKHG